MADVKAIVASVIATVADCTLVDVITTLCWLMVFAKCMMADVVAKHVMADVFAICGRWNSHVVGM